MKGIFVVIDGVADEPLIKLNDKTPLEYAKTPNLDFFASNGELYNCFPIAEGIAPQSSSGLISLFGADFRDYSRGILEAVGAGIHLNDGDLALRVNFSTINNLNSMKLIDRRAGRTLTDGEAVELSNEVNSKLKLPFKFELIHTIGHRGVLIFRGAFSDKITNVDPSYEGGLSVESAQNTVSFSESTDDSRKSIVTADLINTFVRKSYVILENSVVNANRRKKGFLPANFLLCRDPGIGPVKSRKLPGLWMGFGYMPLEIGVSKVLGMRVSSFGKMIMSDEDFYSHAEQVLSNAIKSSIKMIESQRDIVDYFYIHFKETDLPGHDNKPLQKVKFIEMIDREFFGNIRKGDLDFKMVVTADHTTSCRKMAHTSDPVPALFFDFNSIKESKNRFAEKYSIKQRAINGRQLLSKTLLR